MGVNQVQQNLSNQISANGSKVNGSMSALAQGMRV